MPAPRRRLGLLPAGAALSVVAAAAFVVMPGQEQATPPEVTTERVDLTQPAEPVAPGWTGEADVEPELVGVEWEGDPNAAFTIETRDADGNWSPAGTVEAQGVDEGPDDGSPEAAGAVDNVTEPLWVGDDVTGVRVRLDEGGVADIDLHTVASPPAEGADGTAVAADGRAPVPDSAGPDTRLVIAAVALVLAGLVLWRFAPRRRPRRGVAAGVALVVALGLTGCLRAPAPTPTVPPLASIITRAQWSADETLRLTNCPAGPDYMSGGVKFAVVHHTVNSNDYSAAQGPQLVRGIYAYHTQSLGYCDIAYNFLIDRFGNTYEGRYGGINLAVLGAHARGFNTSSVGVALIGDYRTVQPSAESIEAVKQLLVYKFQAHSVDPRTRFYYQTTGNEKFAPGTSVFLAPVTWHGYTGNTACPGDQVIARIVEIYDEVATRLGY